MVLILSIALAGALTFLVNDVTQALPGLLAFLINLGFFAIACLYTHRYLKNLKEL